MADIDLGYAMGLEPKLAVDYFRSKGYQITDDWRELEADAHAKAFTVAKATSIDVLETLRDEVDRALATGITEHEFKKSLTPTLQALGWWGKETRITADGDAKTVQLGSPKRLSTIFRTNLATAYSVGRYQRQLASTETHPYWQYIATIDNNTRQEHAALHLKVFRWDDPIWQKLYPPNGWGCRCRVRALTAAQVEREGLTVESSIGKIQTRKVDIGTNDETGASYTAEVTSYQSGSQSMKTDAGWSGNVSHAAIGSDIAMAKKLTSMQNRQLRQQVIESLNNAPARQSAFSAWIGQALTLKKPPQSMQVLGFMADDINTQIETVTGHASAQLLTIDISTVQAAHSLKLLTFKESQALPQLISKAQAVLFDKEKRKILYISSHTSGQKIIISALVTKSAFDTAVTVYKENYEMLQDGIAQGRYQLLKGALSES